MNNTKIIQDMNEIAINLCDPKKKTLIFTKKTTYVPSLKSICDLKNCVFFTESDEIFTKITSNFDFYDVFILVEKTLNNFEKEFFAQLRLKSNKSIIELNPVND